MVCVERSQDSFVGLVLSFLLYVDSEGGAQVIRLAWQVKYQRRHLSYHSLNNFFKNFK